MENADSYSYKYICRVHLNLTICLKKKIGGSGYINKGLVSLLRQRGALSGALFGDSFTSNFYTWSLLSCLSCGEYL